MDNPAMQPNPITCVCGVDHRQAGSRSCVVFVILDNLNYDIRRFLEVQDVFEFGKDGPMASRLRYVAMGYYGDTIKAFQKLQPIVEQHPEWNLYEPISRLRRYFDQVVRDDCAGDKNRMFGVDPYMDHIVESPLEYQDKLVSDARNRVVNCLLSAGDLIEKHVHSDTLNHRDDRHVDRVMWKVNRRYKDALNAINILPESEKTTAKKLTKDLNEIHKETLRLLCEFHRPSQVIYQSLDAQISAHRR